MLIKLMKYELIRKKNILLTSLAVFVLAELILLFSLYKGGNWMLLFVIASIFLVGGVYLFVLYDNIKLLSDDLNSKSGYMLFLTPNHGYNIVGSKMIVGFIEVIIGTLLLIGAYWINYTYANIKFDGEFFNSIKMIIESIRTELVSVGVNGWHVFGALLGFILQWFFFITTVYLAIILRKTLFSAVKFKGFLSFVVFVVLNIIANTAAQLAIGGITVLGGYGDVLFGANVIEHDKVVSFVNLMILVSNGLNALFIILFFLASGYFLTKKVDL